MSISEEYRIEAFGLHHFPAMNILFASAFNLILDEPSFIKRFNTQSLGAAVVGFIAFHKATNVPAAYYGVFPVKVLMDGKIILTAQSGDTMTHAAHRKKGLFIFLAQQTIKACSKKGFSFIFGQPNESSRHGFLKNLGFHALDNVVRWDLKLSIKTFPLPKLLMPRRKQLYLSYAKKVLKKWMVSPPKGFLNPLQQKGMIILRDENYLDYKQDPQKFFIKINGVFIWIKLTDVFWIGDFSNYEMVAKSLLKRLKKLAFWLGYNTIVFNVKREKEPPAFLQYFKPYSEENSIIFYLDEDCKTHDLKITAADFDTW